MSIWKSLRLRLTDLLMLPKRPLHQKVTKTFPFRIHFHIKTQMKMEKHENSTDYLNIKEKKNVFFFYNEVGVLM